MKQYCRYCVNLCVNNVPYCQAKKVCKSRSSCMKPNKCKEFVFADVEPEYQDAFAITKGYKPRSTIRKGEAQCDGQMTIWNLIPMNFA